MRFITVSAVLVACLLGVQSEAAVRLTCTLKPSSPHAGDLDRYVGRAFVVEIDAAGADDLQDGAVHRARIHSEKAGACDAVASWHGNHNDVDVAANSAKGDLCQVDEINVSVDADLVGSANVFVKTARGSLDSIDENPYYCR